MEKSHYVKKKRCLEQINIRSLSVDTFNQIVELKNSINTLRTNYEGYTISDMITKNWLIGFIELLRNLEMEPFILVILVLYLELLKKIIKY